MRLAIIDLGTNSVRFDVHQIDGARRCRLIHREKLMVRLGQDLFASGKLNREAVSRTLHAFERFRETADQLKASRIVAFATSALREASDRDLLLGKIQKRTGIRVRVISGKEEATLIAEGVLANEKKLPRRFALLDIGGGSTEISFCSRKKILSSKSFPLGTSRLQQLFLKRTPPSPKNLQLLRDFIRETLNERPGAHKTEKPDLVIGSSGTIRALDKILRKGHRLEFTLENLSWLVSEMSRMDTTQLLGIPAMEARRVDMVLAGAVLLEESLKSVSVRKIRATAFSLRDGILREEIQLLGKNPSTHLGLHFPDVREKAIRLGAVPAHLDDLVELSGLIFDRLAKVHKMKMQWKAYLQAAMVLKNTGTAISHLDSEQHTYYIIKNADLPSLDPWERELIGQLCLHQKSEKIHETEFAEREFSNEALGEGSGVFPKLLALFQVVQALDLGPTKVAKLKQVSIRGRVIKIRLAKKKVTGLEIPQLERAKKLFEKVFKRRIEANLG